MLTSSKIITSSCQKYFFGTYFPTKFEECSISRTKVNENIPQAWGAPKSPDWIELNSFGFVKIQVNSKEKQ